jgi:hypothetical protein
LTFAQTAIFSVSQGQKTVSAAWETEKVARFFQWHFACEQAN